jgi:hypothetical protein
MINPDEPLLDRGEKGPPPAAEDFDLTGRLRRLASGQPYAVLCTQGQGQPYGSLVAFAFSQALDQAVFATPVTTRKYRLLNECDHVALVVDDRPDQPADMMHVEAVTVTGRAVEMERGPEFERWASLLVERHPYLASFVAAASCALFRVDVVRCFHVTRFQEVREWRPSPAS